MLGSRQGAHKPALLPFVRIYLRFQWLFWIYTFVEILLYGFDWMKFDKPITPQVKCGQQRRCEEHELYSKLKSYEYIVLLHFITTVNIG